MEEEQQQRQQQQQQQQPLHDAVVNGIARITDPHCIEDERHTLYVACDDDPHDLGLEPPIDRPSLQHIVDFLDNHRRDSSHREVVITELVLLNVALVTHPSPDGGLNVLIELFSRSDILDTTTSRLTKVTLWSCDFGSQPDAEQLLAAFHTNPTITDLTIGRIWHLSEAALGRCLDGILQHKNTTLQRLECVQNELRVDGIRAFQPTLRANRTLKKLSLVGCRLQDDAIRLVADALVGNTAIETLVLNHNYITSAGLDDITRILVSTPQLKTLHLKRNPGTSMLFDNEDATRRFARVVSRKTSLKELNIAGCQLGNVGIRIIVDALVGNTTMYILDIGSNKISFQRLDDITRLLVSTQLQTINLSWNQDIFKDKTATEHFVTTLQQKKSSLQDLPIDCIFDFPGRYDQRSVIVASIQSCLTRNQQLNRVGALFLLPPSPPLPPPPPLLHQQQQQHATTTHSRVLKISHQAITKLAANNSNAQVVASAIFQLLQVRPALLEKQRIKKRQLPDAAAAAAAAVIGASANCAGNNTGSQYHRQSTEGGGGNNNNNNNNVNASSLAG
jgi:Leucine Rich repeat